MGSNTDAAKAGVAYIPTVWEVASEIYAWYSASDPMPDIPIPEGWELQHKDADVNPSNT